MRERLFIKQLEKTRLCRAFP